MVFPLMEGEPWTAHDICDSSSGDVRDCDSKRRGWEQGKDKWRRHNLLGDAGRVTPSPSGFQTSLEYDGTKGE